MQLVSSASIEPATQRGSASETKSITKSASNALAETAIAWLADIVCHLSGTRFYHGHEPVQGQF